MPAPMFPAAAYAKASASGIPAEIHEVIVKHAQAVEAWQAGKAVWSEPEATWKVAPLIGTVQLTVRPLPKEIPMWLISIKVAAVLAPAYFGWVLFF